jgi:hypothetical protein
MKTGIRKLIEDHDLQLGEPEVIEVDNGWRGEFTITETRVTVIGDFETECNNISYSLFDQLIYKKIMLYPTVDHVEIEMLLRDMIIPGWYDRPNMNDGFAHDLAKVYQRNYNDVINDINYDEIVKVIDKHDVEQDDLCLKLIEDKTGYQFYTKAMLVLIEINDEWLDSCGLLNEDEFHKRDFNHVVDYIYSEISDRWYNFHDEIELEEFQQIAVDWFMSLTDIDFNTDTVDELIDLCVAECHFEELPENKQFCQTDKCYTIISTTHLLYCEACQRKAGQGKLL